MIKEHNLVVPLLPTDDFRNVDLVPNRNSNAKLVAMSGWFGCCSLITDFRIIAKRYSCKLNKINFKKANLAQVSQSQTVAVAYGSSRIWKSQASLARMDRKLKIITVTRRRKTLEF